MNDMSQVIVPKSDQYNAEDFLAGPRTFRIEAVSITPGQEQPVSITLAGETRVWRPCKSMSRCLVAIWGPDAKAYIGRSLTLYCDPKVKWGGMEVGGIRISHMTDIASAHTMALTATKGNKKPFTVKPLTVVQEAPSEPSDPALEKYPTLFEADGRKWMTNLKTVLASALTLADIAEIEAVSSVSGALANAPPAVKSEIRSMLAGAKARVTPPAGMPDFANAPEHDAA